MTDGYMLDESSLRFLAALRHWWDGYGGETPPTPAGGGVLPPTLDWFKLAEVLNPGGEADARRCYYSSATKQRTSTASVTPITDTTGRWFALPGDYLLCRALGSDDGVIWEPLARLGSTHAWGKLDDNILAGSSGTVSLWNDSATGLWDNWDADSGVDLEAYLPPMMATGSLLATAWVRVKFGVGRHVIDMTGCA